MPNTNFNFSNGFTKIDNDVFYLQSELSASAFSILVRVYRATHGYSMPVKSLSGSYLQKTTNLSKNTITKATKELEDLGLLLVKRRARLASYYQLSVVGISKLCSEIKAKMADVMGSLDEGEELEDAEGEMKFDLGTNEELLDSTEDKPEKVDLPENGFEIFWNIYDKNVGKSAAKKVWCKLSKLDQKNIMSNLESYVNSKPEKAYRKDPINYLNGRTWEDEVVAPFTPMDSIDNKTPQPQNFPAPVYLDRDVVVAGSDADNKINDFLGSFGRKGETYA